MNANATAEPEFEPFDFLQEEHELDAKKWWDDGNMGTVTAGSSGGIILYCHTDNMCNLSDLLNAGLKSLGFERFEDFIAAQKD